MKELYSNICAFMFGFSSILNLSGQFYTSDIILPSNEESLKGDIETVAKDFRGALNTYERK